MVNIEVSTELKNILVGRSISKINKSQDFIIELNHYPVKHDEYPKLVTFSMLSDWYIKEIGDWNEVNNLFPLNTSDLSIPYDPIRAFYLHYLSENRKITDVVFNTDSHLEIIFNTDFTLVLPNVNDYGEFAWTATGNNLNIAYNSEENKCYFEFNA